MSDEIMNFRFCFRPQAFVLSLRNLGVSIQNVLFVFLQYLLKCSYIQCRYLYNYNFVGITRSLIFHPRVKQKTVMPTDKPIPQKSL